MAQTEDLKAKKAATQLFTDWIALSGAGPKEPERLPHCRKEVFEVVLGRKKDQDKDSRNRKQETPEPPQDRARTDTAMTTDTSPPATALNVSDIRREIEREAREITKQKQIQEADEYIANHSPPAYGSWLSSSKKSEVRPTGLPVASSNSGVAYRVRETMTYTIIPQGPNAVPVLPSRKETHLPGPSKEFIDLTNLRHVGRVQSTNAYGNQSRSKSSAVQRHYRSQPYPPARPKSTSPTGPGQQQQSVSSSYSGLLAMAPSLSLSKSSGSVATNPGPGLLSIAPQPSAKGHYRSQSLNPHRFVQNKSPAATSSLNLYNTNSQKSQPVDRPWKCHHPSKKDPSKPCTSSFMRQDELKRHMKIHNPNKPFKCQFCDMRFSRTDHLTTHTRTHTKEKPYICQYEGCNKAFARSDERLRHHTVHENRRRKQQMQQAEAHHGGQSYGLGASGVSQGATHTLLNPGHLTVSSVAPPMKRSLRYVSEPVLSGNHLAPINMAPTSSSSQPDLLLQSFTPNESPPVTYPPTPVRSSNNSGAEDNSGEKM